MAYVVTEACLDCKYTDCAAICPTEAFHRGEHQLYINPGTCIDCDACVGECPVHAIYPEAEVPDASKAYIAINRDECEKYPVINEILPMIRGEKCRGAKAAPGHA